MTCCLSDSSERLPVKRGKNKHFYLKDFLNLPIFLKRGKTANLRGIDRKLNKFYQRICLYFSIYLTSQQNAIGFLFFLFHAFLIRTCHKNQMNYFAIISIERLATGHPHPRKNKENLLHFETTIAMRE